MAILSNIKRFGDFIVQESTERVNEVGRLLSSGVEELQEIGEDLVEGTKGANDAVQAFGEGFDIGAPKFIRGANESVREFSERFDIGLRSGTLSTASAVEVVFSIGAEKLGADQLAEKLRTLSENDAELGQVGVVVNDSQKFVEKITDPAWLGQGIGQTLPTMFAGMGLAIPAAVAGAPTLVVGGLAFLGAATIEAGFAFNDAKEFGVDDEKAEKVAGIVGMINGLLEAMPLVKLLTRSPAGKQVKRSLIRTITGRVVAQTALESSTESVQEIVSNTVALTYDENRDILTGVAEAGFLGGVVGGGVSAGIDVATSVKVPGLTTEDVSGIPEELETLAQKARASESVEDFVSSTIFEDSLSGSETKSLSNFEGENVSDQLTDLFNRAKREGLAFINPALFRKAEKATNVDEFVESVIKADKTTIDKVSVPNLTEFFNRVKGIEAVPTEDTKAVTERVDRNIATFQRTGEAIPGDSQPRNSSLEALQRDAEIPEVKVVQQKNLQEAIDSEFVKVNEDGTITLFRAGKPVAEDRLVSATFDKKIAQLFVDKADGEIEITEFNVKPEDVKIFIGQAESEVLVSSATLKKATEAQEPSGDFGTEAIDRILSEDQEFVTETAQERDLSEEELLQEVFNLEFENIKKAGKKSFFDDILAEGGIKTSFGLVEETSAIPLRLRNKNGQTQDEMAQSLNTKGYNFEDGEDLRLQIIDIEESSSRTISSKRSSLGKFQLNIKKPMSDRALLLLQNRLIREATSGRAIPPAQQIRISVAGEPSPLITKRETTLLKEKIRNLARGAREGVVAKKRETGKVQNDIIELIEDSTLPLNDKAKFLRLLKNVQTVEQFNRRVEEIQSRITTLEEKATTRSIHSKIVSELKGARETISKANLRKGKFGAEFQEKLNRIREVSLMDRSTALATMADNIAKHSGMSGTILTIPAEVMIENEILQMAGIARLETAHTLSTEELQEHLDNILNLKATGRTIRELRDFNKQEEIDQKRNAFMDVITGGRGLREGTGTVPIEEEGRFGGVRDFFDAHLGLDFIMERLSRFDRGSEPLDSILNREGNRVHDARNQQTSGIREAEEKMYAKFAEVYNVEPKGKAFRKEVAEQLKEVSLGKFKGIEFKMNRTQLRKKWMEIQDKSLADTFENMGWTSEVIAAVDKTMTAQDKEFAQWQMNEFYPEYREGINDIYKDVFGINLGKIENYSPIRRKVDTIIPEHIQLVNDLQRKASTQPGSLKVRVQSTLSLDFIGDMQSLQSHITEMEHFKAYVEVISDFRRIFTGRVKEAIIQYHGKGLSQKLEKMTDDLARDGIDWRERFESLDKLRGNFAVSALGLNPTIMFKQLTSIPAYLVEMPTTSWVRYSAEFWTNPRKNAAILMKSETLKARYKLGAFDRDVKLAFSKGATANKLSGREGWREHIMSLVRLGDRGAILVGGYPVYKYNLVKLTKQGLSPEEAQKEAMKVCVPETSSTFATKSASPMKSCWV